MRDGANVHSPSRDTSRRAETTRRAFGCGVRVGWVERVGWGVGSVRIAVANNKGGAGKTTVITYLTEALAARGHRVLAVDMDPQANLSRRLGYGEAELVDMVTTAEVVAANSPGCAAEDIVGCRWSLPGYPGLVEHIDVLPARYDLEARVSEAGTLGAHERLDRALQGSPRTTTPCSWTARPPWGT